MIRPGVLSASQRAELLGLLRNGLVEQRVGRRANAVLLLDDGLSCEEAAKVLYVDDDTVRTWRKAYDEEGVSGLSRFDFAGSCGHLSSDQEAAVKAYVTANLPHSTRQIGAFIEKEFGIVYESRSGLIKMLHRLGFEYRKPKAMPRGLDDATQQAFIDGYENRLNTMDPDETVLFLDAAHPTHQVKPAGCWAPKDVAIAVEQTTGRDRLNIHGAINLETGKTHMLVVDKVNAESFIKLLSEIESTTAMRVIHAFVDRASYHRADIVKEWLARAGRKIVLHLLPPYCPHLNPIERLWGLMHKNVTHNRDYKTFAEFRREVLKFLRQTVPKNWKRYCDRITDNFRVIHRADFRVIA